MRASIVTLGLLALIACGIPESISKTPQTNKPFVIAAGTVFDGKGRVPGH